MGKSSGLLVAAGLRFKNIVTRTMSYRANISPIARDIDVFLNVTNPDVIEFSLEMDESYHLNVTLASIEKINVTITGSTFFGVRHGLETLSQLFIYDDHRKFPLIVSSASIHDSPKYTYRGLMLDTSRNYYPVSSIKRTIDAMAMVKMNSFHWHITDSQSFPFVSERRPNMSRIGAYSPSKVYTKKVIQDISRFALVRGVRVVPELDAPAHVGEGWQGTNLTVCFNVEPWEVYCGEPPCGQLNPIDDNVYNYLEDIYTDMAEAFVTTDLFHMGSDEVNERCWRSYEPIENYMRGNFYLEQTSFVEMWSFFQKKAHYKVYKAFKTKIPLVIWSSTLTNSYTVEEYLDVKEYIIQIWTGSGDVQVRTLLNKGFKLILSNPEQLYLDCGFGGWLEEGENWCTPYKSWKVIYEHNPSDIAGSRCHLILGSEAALWSEEADAGNLDSRLWPRLGALAERLWSDPTSSWRDAEQRMLHLNSSEDELVDNDNVENDDKQEPDYLLHSHSFNDIDAINNFAAYEVNDRINYNNAPSENKDYMRKFENSLKAKCMEKRQHIHKRKYLNTSKHRKHETEAKSDEEEKILPKIQVQTDAADYIHVPAYEMENILVEDTKCTPVTSTERTLQRERHSKSHRKMEKHGQTIVQNVTSIMTQDMTGLMYTKPLKILNTDLKSINYNVINPIYKPSPMILSIAFSNIPRLFHLVEKHYFLLKSKTYWLDLLLYAMISIAGLILSVLFFYVACHRTVKTMVVPKLIKKFVQTAMLVLCIFCVYRQDSDMTILRHEVKSIVSFTLNCVKNSSNISQKGCLNVDILKQVETVNDSVRDVNAILKLMAGNITLLYDDPPRIYCKNYSCGWTSDFNNAAKHNIRESRRYLLERIDYFETFAIEVMQFSKKAENLKNYYYAPSAVMHYLTVAGTFENIHFYFYIISAIGLVILEQFRKKMTYTNKQIILLYSVCIMAFCWLWAAQSTVFWLATSDFCTHPVKSILILIDEPEYDHVIKYFLTCDESSKSPAKKLWPSNEFRYWDLHNITYLLEYTELQMSLLKDKYGEKGTYYVFDPKTDLYSVIEYAIVYSGKEKLEKIVSTLNEVIYDGSSKSISYNFLLIQRACSSTRDSFKRLYKQACSSIILLHHIFWSMLSGISYTLLMMILCGLEYP
ncbi:uncharacterized protein LOC113233930 [Hyposmocoma kahamanoa]|uniref:uncharacterized protein LOC113233930 n=1 Tax=Hyposmocoma kahamanoa TaxID=1477025 RepID=UPI000E6D91A8|nr:uncharacterized protein LOC113233930 [Hyposmocoma kahamanoa]